MSKSVRVRFAPSPTGPLHIGGVRTALYNYLFAKKNSGSFILRIEDTDQTRYVSGAEEYIKESLAWAGIEPNEGPDYGGEYGPYRQSERKELYGQYAMQLIESGNAYYAFDTEEELNEMRERLKAARVASPQYNAITRLQMKNSLTLPADEVQKRLDNGEPYVIRLKVPRKEEIRLKDSVRGWVVVHSSSVDDKVIMKSDGMPTYHLANVVDDHLMKITHVIRGEEWLPSAPLHVLLYEYLGWKDSMPEMAHLPLILKPDGNGKLSKRDGDKNGYPVFPLDWTDPKTGDKSMGFRERGFLPDATVNFLSLLGWNPGGNDEVFTKNELLETFSIERIGKSGAKFDFDKAKWLNQQHLKKQSNEVLAKELKPQFDQAGAGLSVEQIAVIVGQLKERVTFANEFLTEGKVYFERPKEYDEKVVHKKWDENAKKVISKLASDLPTKELKEPQDYKQTIYDTTQELEIPMGKVMQAIRVAATGKGAGPDLMEILHFLGSKEVSERFKIALEKLN